MPFGYLAAITGSRTTQLLRLPAQPLPIAYIKHSESSKLHLY